MPDQVSNGITSIIRYGIARFQNHCPVVKGVFVQVKDGQLGFRGVVKCRFLERFEDVLV